MNFTWCCGIFTTVHLHAMCIASYAMLYLGLFLNILVCSRKYHEISQLFLDVQVIRIAMEGSICGSRRSWDCY